MFKHGGDTRVAGSPKAGSHEEREGESDLANREREFGPGTREFLVPCAKKSYPDLQLIVFYL